LAVARPLLLHDETSGPTGERLLIVVDDGWAAARQWPQRERMLGAIIDAADRSRAPVALAVTAPQSQPSELQFRAAAEARDKAAAIAPRALETDRLALLERLRTQLDGSTLQVVWLLTGSIQTTPWRSPTGSKVSRAAMPASRSSSRHLPTSHWR
jgi:hypothetical protein